MPFTEDQKKWIQKFKHFGVNEPKQLHEQAAKERSDAQVVMKGKPGDGLVEMGANQLKGMGMLTDAARLDTKAAGEEQELAELQEQFAAGGKKVNSVTFNFQLPDGQMILSAVASMVFQSKDGVPPTNVEKTVKGGVCTVEGLVLSQTGLLSLKLQLPAGSSLGKVTEPSGAGKWTLGRKPFLNVDVKLKGRQRTVQHKEGTSDSRNTGYEGNTSNEKQTGANAKVGGSAKVGVAGKASENLGVEQAEVSGNAEVTASGEVSGSYSNKTGGSEKRTRGGTATHTQEDSMTDTYWVFESGLEIKISA